MYFLTLLVAVLTLVATFTVPEIRALLGLDAPKETLVDPGASQSEPEEYTLYGDQPQFIKKAQVSLAVVFYDVKVACFRITSDLKNFPLHNVEAGYKQVFTSSAGTFFVQILHIDYEGKSIRIQLTKKPVD